VAAAVLMMGTWSPGSGSAQAQEDPVAVAEALIAEFNDSLPAGDGAAIAAHFTEDGTVTFLDVEGSFGIFGRPAMEIAFSDEPDSQFSLTATEITADGDTVTGTIEFRDSVTAEAGIERGLANFTAVVDGDLVASLDVVDDLSDPQTAELAEYLASQPDEGDDDDGPPPENFVELAMTGEQAGEAEEGGAFLGEFDAGVVGVFVGVMPGPEGVRQPSGIYEGTCDDLGDLAQQLASLWEGGAGSLISADFAGFLDEPHAVVVAASPDDPDTIVACGDIERAAATATPGVTLPETGSGAGGADGSAWPVVALAAAGLAAIAATGALRLRRR
jgi:ketosteroid isomerase-like protein